MLSKALEKYLELLNKEQYFDAHEILEEAWHPLRRANHPLKNLVKGFINASVAFEHIKRATPNAYNRANKVFVGYTKYIHMLNSEIEEFYLFKKAQQKVSDIANRYNLK